MSITLQFESYEEMVGFAQKLLVEAPSQQEKAPKPEKKAVQEEVVKEEVVKEEETKTYTLEEVRAALAVLTRSGKQQQLKELLTSFGADKLTAVDPKDYAALMEKAGAL